MVSMVSMFSRKIVSVVVEVGVVVALDIRLASDFFLQSPVLLDSSKSIFGGSP